MRLDSRLEEVARMDRRLTSLFDGTPAMMPVFDAVRLSVAEAVNNCIEHAYSNEPGHPIEVSFEMATASVTVTIQDSGRAVPDGVFDCVQLPEFDPDDLSTFPEGGFGLFIIKTQMDDVSYQSCDGVNTLTLVKSLNTET